MLQRAKVERREVTLALGLVGGLLADVEDEDRHAEHEHRADDRQADRGDCAGQMRSGSPLDALQSPGCR